MRFTWNKVEISRTSIAASFVYSSEVQKPIEYCFNK